MNFSGVLHGFIQPQGTVHTWTTSSPMATHWELMKMTTPSVGMTSGLEPKFYFPRSYYKPQEK